MKGERSKSDGCTRCELGADVKDTLALVEDEVARLELDVLVLEDVAALVILRVAKHRTSLLLLGQVVANVNGAAFAGDRGVLAVDFGQWEPLVHNYTEATSACASQ